jgi:diguanylate cyclase (GGDEF)-like protein
MKTNAHIPALCIAAVLSFGPLAAPAGADLTPGNGQEGNSVLPSDPLGDRIGDSLGDIPGIGAPKPKEQPKPETIRPVDSAPRSSAPHAVPTGKVSKPKTNTAKTPTTATGSHHSRSSDGPAGPVGPKRTGPEPVTKPHAADVPSPTSSPTEPGPEAPSTFVDSVASRIPAQYRWPVLVLACLVVLFAFTSLRERRRSVRVERAAFVDSLTGLPNRPAFERRLAKEWRRSERYNRPLGMLLIDLDDFKHVNDTQGHAAGDAVLQEVAASISGRIRVSDMAARLGGDEFVVICPETPLEGLKVLARSLEECLSETAIATSIGYTEREPADEDPEHFVERADAAMYRRKQRARQQRKRGTPRVAAPSLAAATAE